MTSQKGTRRPNQPAGQDGSAPSLQEYAKEMVVMLRQRSPAAYRAFLSKWSHVHEGNVANRLMKLDDAALRLRIERMILDTPTLADLHASARAYIEQRAAEPKVS